MKRFYILCVLVVLHLSGMAQWTIKGKVIDASTREPLELANIQIQNSNNSVLSDSKGDFTIMMHPVDLLPTAIPISISYIGFQSKEINAFPNAGPLLVELAKSEIRLQEVIITPQSNSHSINIISKIDLNVRPVKSSQELLRIVPGLFISQHAGGGKAEQIFLRGFDLDHGTDIKINVDGMPVNMVSHAHGQGYADLHFVIPELVKNIDYGLGPYYTTQGNLNVAGYVDLNTYNSIKASTVKAEVGQFNTWRGLTIIDLLSKKNKEKNKNWYIAGEYLYSDGPFESPQKFNRSNLFSKYSSKLGKKSFVSLQASAFNSSWNASGQLPQRVVTNGTISRFGSIDDKEGGVTQRTNVNAILTTKLTEQLNLTNQAFYSRYNFTLFSNFTFFLADTVNGDQIKQNEKRAVWGYSGKLDFIKTISTWSSKLTTGIGVRTDKITGSELSHTKNRAEVLEKLQYGDIHETNAFAYVEETINNNKWLINIGSRFDFFTFQYTDHLLNNVTRKNAASVVSPKINLQYTINRQTQVYVKLGKGFHSNDTRIVIDRTKMNGLPAAYGTDVGVLLKPAKKLIVSAALWYLYLQQEFVYVGDAGVIEPGGKTKRMGIDVSARYQFTQWLLGDITVNGTRPRTIGVPKGEAYIPLAPTFSSVGGLNFLSKNGLNASMRYRFIGDRPANENGLVIAKGYTVFDAAINYTKKKYELGLFAENLFNVTWNEAQFNTESRLKNEPKPVSELHFTPGNPFNIRVKLAVFF